MNSYQPSHQHEQELLSNILPRHNRLSTTSETTLPELDLADVIFIDDVLQQSALDTFDYDSDADSSYSDSFSDHSDNENEGEHDSDENDESSVAEEQDPAKHLPNIAGDHVHQVSRSKSRIARQRSKLSRSASKKSIKDPDLVTWDGPDDLLNPQNWPKHKKWTSMLLVSMFTFISPMASTMIAPALDTIAADFNITSSSDKMLVMAIFLLAYAIGPFLWGPLSEVFGRVKVLQSANMIFLLFNTVCGFAKSKQQLMAFRFLSGIGGSAPQAIGGGVLSDCFRAEERGNAVAIYSLMPFISPAVAPIMGAYLTQYTTWRWVFWATSVFDLAVQITCFFLLRETYPAAILARRVKELKKSTGNEALHTKWQGPGHSLKKILMKSLVRPFIMLTTQPALQAMALFRAYQYGLMYLVLATFPMVFEQSYGQDVGRASLNYLSLGVGFVIGLQISGILQDRIYTYCKTHHIDPSAPIFKIQTWQQLLRPFRRRQMADCEAIQQQPDEFSRPGMARYASIKAKALSSTSYDPSQFTIPRKPLPIIRTRTSQRLRLQRRATLKGTPVPQQTAATGLPEHRLPLTLPSSLLISLGLFIYGFSAAARTHWFVPNLGACIMSVGLIISFNAAQTYVVDTYTTYSASATGAAAFVRTMAGFSFPLFAPRMYEVLGVGWGNGLLGFLSLGLGIACSIGLWRWGSWLRARSTYCTG